MPERRIPHRQCCAYRHETEGLLLVGSLPADPFDFEANFRVLYKERPDIEQMTTCEQHVEIVSSGTFAADSVTVAIWKQESPSFDKTSTCTRVHGP